MKFPLKISRLLSNIGFYQPPNYPLGVHLVVLVLVIVIYTDVIVGLSASMSIQEKIPMKNIEERLASLAVVATSEQALHLCWVVG